MFKKDDYKNSMADGETDRKTDRDSYVRQVNTGETQVGIQTYNRQTYKPNRQTDRHTGRQA